MHCRIRQGSQLIGGYNRILSVDPFEHFKVVDCGDFLLTPFDNLAALDQLEQSYYDLISRKPATEGRGGKGKDGKEYSRLVTLGGDHTIVLPILRALEPIYGPIT
jgi:agmatinase